MVVRKAVITSAGLGTRMKYISNFIPKALLPVFSKEDEGVRMRPLVDVIMGSLQKAGISDFCFVIDSRSKMLKDYFAEKAVSFVMQDEPKGFGDAILKAEGFVGSEPFFVNANDSVLTGCYEEGARFFDERKPAALLFLKHMKDTSRYGVVTGKDTEPYLGHNVIRVDGAEEKPKAPKSDLCICATYIFTNEIFVKLKQIKSEGELQLTSGIQKLIDDGLDVYGMILENEKDLDIGNPDSYFSTLEYTYRLQKG